MSLSYAVTSTEQPERQDVSLATTEQRLLDGLTELYGPFVARQSLPRLLSLLAGRPRPPRFRELTEDDVVLIAYPDHVQGDGLPLHLLASHLNGYLGELVSNVHLLPFHPSTSDGGFAVSDFETVNPNLGSWSDIAAIAESHGLMVDCVLNHVSTSHLWFQGFLAGDPRYADFFVTVDEPFDASMVPRPRNAPLVTRFDSAGGSTLVWTTFGHDQVDLNYRCPDVLLEIVRAILGYVEHGARVLRLDATNLLWKESGTACSYLPQSTTIVQLLRDVLDLVDPSVIVATGTNDSEDDDAEYVLQSSSSGHVSAGSALPGLLVETMHTGDSSILSSWAAHRRQNSQGGFFNFTASHDGIALQPLTRVLSPDDLEGLVRRTVANGGRLSMGRTQEGEAPYELNVRYFDAISGPEVSEPDRLNRFMVTQSIMLALAGLPTIYLPSLFGATERHEDDDTGVDGRDLNRRRFDNAVLSQTLSDDPGHAGRVLRRYEVLLRVRRSHAAFHPSAPQEVLNMGAGLVAIQRTSHDGKEAVLALHNVMDAMQIILEHVAGPWIDLLTSATFEDAVTLRPYEVLWLSRPPA